MPDHALHLHAHLSHTRTLPVSELRDDREGPSDAGPCPTLARTPLTHARSPHTHLHTPLTDTHTSHTHAHFLFQSYVTIAKGPLVPDHVLILPIAHFQSIVSAPPGVNAEIEKYPSPEGAVTVTHSHTHTDTHTQSHTHTQHMDSHIHTQSHTHMRTHTHMRAHTHTQARLHTHTHHVYVQL